MKKLLLIFLVVSQFSFAKDKEKVECDFFVGQYCATVKFISGPNRSESSDFELRFYRDYTTGRRQVFPRQELFIYLWMKMANGHEHGSDKVKIINKKTYFLVQNVWFLMKGPWQVHVQFRNSKGEILSSGMHKVCIGKVDDCVVKEDEKELKEAKEVQKKLMEATKEDKPLIQEKSKN
jgi:hypothetical protein